MAKDKEKEQDKLQEGFFKTLLDAKNCSNVSKVQESLNAAAESLRKVKEVGFKALTQAHIESKVLNEAKGFEVEKPKKILKKKAMKQLQNSAVQGKGEEKKDKNWHSKVLTKYSKEFFDKLGGVKQNNNDFFSDTQKKDLLKNLSEVWNFELEYDVVADEKDLSVGGTLSKDEVQKQKRQNWVNYVRYVWMKYSLGSLKQKDSQPSVVANKSAAPTIALQNFKLSLAELNNLFNVQQDCKDRKSALAALLRTDKLLTIKNFSKLTKGEIEDKDYGPKYNLPELKFLSKRKEKKGDEKLEGRDGKKFLNQLLTKHSLDFFNGLKNVGENDLRGLISDLALEWLFEPKLNAKTPEGKDVPKEDVVNYIRHVWVKHVRSKLKIEYEQVKKLLESKQEIMLNRCSTEMQRLFDNAKRTNKISEEEFVAMQQNVKSSMEGVFKEIISNMFPNK